jgi:AcrR family transcriptional regulator
MPPTPTSTAPATASREGTGRWNDVAEAALSLFSERGYHGTTMKHVAAELGVQAPSLYNHVGSKQEILARLMKTGMERMIAKQDEALASTDDVVEQLRLMTEAHVLVHTSHRRSALIGDRELRNLEEPARTEQRGRRELYERRFRDTIERGVLQGAFKVNSPKLASFAIIEMATSVAVWFRDEGPLSENDVAHEYGQMALRIVGVVR